MDYSILIPVKNEPQKMVQDLINELRKVLKKESCEIIVIDQEQPTIKLEKCKVLQQKSKGLGKAVLEGVEEAQGKYIITMDADHSHRPLDVYVLIQLSKLGHEIILGSKQLGKSNDGFMRKMLSDVSSKSTLKILNLKGMTDPLTGLSCIKKKVYDELKLKPWGFKIITEILRKTRNEYTPVEQPIIFEKRKGGKSKMNVSEFLRTGFFILKLKFSK